VALVVRYPSEDCSGGSVGLRFEIGQGTLDQRFFVGQVGR
jgi:hypothetical protein